MIKIVIQKFTNKYINTRFSNKTKIKVKIISSMLIILVFIVTADVVLAASQTPTLITKIGSAFKEIKEYLIKLAGPIAAVAIVVGIIIRKLSFGDEEKMVIGKRVIVNAIGGYFVILLVDFIIKFVEALV